MQYLHLLLISAMLASSLLLVAADDSCPPGMYPNLSIGGEKTKLLISDRVMVPNVTADEGLAILKAYGPYFSGILPPVQWQTITAMEVLSQSLKKAFGGCVKVIGGGLDSIYATLEFQAKKGHEINYTVKIYGN